MRNTNTGDQQNDIFAELLNKFDTCTTKKEWEALIEETKTRAVNFRQRQAVIERCQNSINGTYGSSKRPEHFLQGKSK